jgi:hypothetical protein
MFVCRIFFSTALLCFGRADVEDFCAVVVTIGASLSPKAC